MLGLGRTHPRGLADLLNYAALVDDGVILLKDGAFLAALRRTPARTWTRRAPKSWRSCPAR